MQLIERSPNLKPRHRVLYTLFAFLFLIAGFYYQDNLGGEGLSLPFNAVIWIPVVLIIAAGLITMIRSQLWVKPRLLGVLLLFPAGIVAGGFVSGMERPSEWIIRLGVLVGGILFWFSLLQYRFKRRDQENLLYLLLAAMLVHAMVGLMQLVPLDFIKGWIPISPNHQLLGMFQQPNLQASLMATAVALSIYLATLPGFGGQRWPMKSLVYLTLGLSVFEVFGSGSRTGILGLGVAVLLLLISRFPMLRKFKARFLLILFTIVLGSGLGVAYTEGALRAYSKLELMAQNGKDARPHVYRIAVDVFKKSPLTGYGIGSFQREFQNERAIYSAQSDSKVIDAAPRFSHPHNELLFWAIEGGLMALLSIAAAVVAVFLQLWRMGWQRGGAVAALLLPITLHTQVELPFYISTLHWLVLLVLLVVCFTPFSQVKPLGLSASARGLVSGVSVLSVPLVTMFLVHSLVAQTGIMQYLKSRGAQPFQLNYVLNNLYFRETGEYFSMRALLYSQIQQKKHEHIAAFISWAEQFLHQIPDMQIFRDLAVAYEYEGRNDEAKAVIARARAIYPEVELLVDANKVISSGGSLVPESRP